MCTLKGLVNPAVVYSTSSLCLKESCVQHPKTSVCLLVMFVFGSKKTQFWVTVTIVVLCISVSPHSGNPLAQNDEDLIAANDNHQNEENQELMDNEDIALEEDQDVEESTGADNDKKNCIKEGRICKDKAECCDSKMDCTILEVTYTRCLALDSRGEPMYPPRLRDDMNFYE